MPTFTSVSAKLQSEQRCPQCAALVPPGCDWCTLCYADLRAAPTSPPSAVSPSPVSKDAVSSTPPVSATADAGWPCQRCGGVVALDEAACTHCGARFLEGGDDTDPVVRRLRGGLTTQIKVTIMVGGAAALLLVIFGVGYLLQAVF